MKGSIYQLLIFLLMFVSLSAGLCLTGYFLWFDTGFFPSGTDNSRFVLMIPSFLFYVMPFSVISSIILSLFTTLKRKVNRVLSVLFILAAGTGIYYYGFTGFSSLEMNVLQNKTEPELILYAGKLNPFKSGIIYVGKTDAEKAYNVVIEVPDTINSSFTYTHSMDLKALKQKIGINSENSKIDRRLAANPYFSGVFSVPGFLENFLYDLRVFSSEMKTLYSRSRLYFLIAVISQVLFAISCWGLLRISRWPLISVFISFFFIRILFAVYTFWDSIILGNLEFIKNNMLRDNLFSAVLVFFSLLFFMADSILRASDTSSEEVQHG